MPKTSLPPLHWRVTKFGDSSYEMHSALCDEGAYHISIDRETDNVYRLNHSRIIGKLKHLSSHKTDQQARKAAETHRKEIIKNQ